jgi:hypothetical protein
MKFPLLKRYPWLGTTLEWLIKIIIFVLLAWAIYQQVFLNKDIGAIKASLQKAIEVNKMLSLLAVVLVMVNWGLETAKWKLMVHKVEPIGFWRAYMAVLCGVTFTMFTPNRMGEYGGRFLFLKEPLRPAAFQATLLGSIAQIIATLFFGVIALGLYFNRSDSSFLSHNIFGLLWIMVAVPLLLFIYFNADVILGKMPFKERWKNIIFTWVHYTKTELGAALGLALARFMVYSIQFLLLLQVFTGKPCFDLWHITGVWLVFLIQTVVPSIALFDLGVRGNAAIALLDNGTAAAQVLAAAYALWFVNLVLPAVLGFFIILGRRLFKTST